MSELSIGVLATNFNSWQLVRRCAEGVVSKDAGNYHELLVYDDCSSEQCDETLPAPVRLYRGKHNLGLTKALNRGFQLLNQDIIVIFDADAFPTTPFCDEVRSMFEQDKQLGLVALRTVGSNGSPTESFSAEPNIWSLLLGQALYGRLEDRLADKSGRISAFTCAMAVRREAFDQLNGFDEHFDWLDLDHDFSMRMNRSGWRIAVASNARIFHEGGGTPQLVRNRVARFYKTRWYLLRKFDKIPNRRVVKALILIRLGIELLLLLAFGEFLFHDKAAQADKVRGRLELLRLCFRMY